ncbi:hypothetical protein N8537_02375 [Synechococcus sp. AH-601-J22]|nr:hypothetical protein [Synechococcus sp. AH-601-J22]
MKSQDFKNHFKTFSYQVAILLVTLSILEVLSFTAIASRRGFWRTIAFNPFLQVIKNKVESITGINKSVTTLGNFSPLVQDRFQPDSNYGPLKINECGYISNQRNEKKCLSKLFAKDAFKVFLIGGSSMAGSGVEDNKDTISSIIQSTLSSQYPDKDFQVFNFGAGGSYTFRQASLILSEIISYKPNIILSFDGFNDAFYWHLEPLRGNKNLINNKPIPNWADYSYLNYLDKTGQGTRQGQLFLTYTIELMRSLGTKVNPSDKWQYSSEYLLSRKFVNTPKVAASFFYRNVSSMALNTVHSSDNSCFIEVLQGDSHHNSNRTNSDELNLRKWHEHVSSEFGVAYAYENYKSNMLPLYTAYFNALTEDAYNLKNNLKGKYAWYDLRDLFKDADASVSYYVDNIHTNLNGNRVLSASFLDFIKKTSCFKKYMD